MIKPSRIRNLLDFLDLSDVIVLVEHRAVLPDHFTVRVLEEPHLTAVEETGRQVAEAVQHHCLSFVLLQWRPRELAGITDMTTSNSNTTL